MKRSWRKECADIWWEIAKHRDSRCDIAWANQAVHNQQILLAADNIARNRPGDNYL